MIILVAMVSSRQQQGTLGRKAQAEQRSMAQDEALALTTLTVTSEPAQ